MLIKRWQTTPKELTFDEFNATMGELGFNDVRRSVALYFLDFLFNLDSDGVSVCLGGR